MAKKEVSQAAQKVAAAEKKSVKKAKNPEGNWFKRAGKAIKKFWKDLRGEVKKIVWPDGKMVLKSTGVVLVAVAICAVAIFAVDQLLAWGISLLEHLAEKASESGAQESTAAIMSIGKYFLGLG